jgi:hypothetical protein
MNPVRQAVQRRWVVVALAAMLVQTPRLPAKAGQSSGDGASVSNPGRIVFQHDGKNINGFVLYLQPESGSFMRIDLGMLRPDVKGLISTTIPRLPSGAYRVEVAAYNGSGESPRVAADPPWFIVTGSAATRSEANHAADVPNEPVQDPTPKDMGEKKSDKSGSKTGIGKRFWKVLVGDDDKP